MSARAATRLLTIVLSSALLAPAAARAQDAPVEATAGQGAGPQVGPAPLVASGKVQGAGWRLRALQERLDRPAPADPDATKVTPCLALLTASARIDLCASDGPPRAAFTAAALSRCTGVGGAVAVLVRPRVNRLTAVLGDGTRRTLKLRSLPSEFAGLRAGVLAVAPSVAVRRIVATGETPAEGGTLDLALPPGAVTCAAGKSARPARAGYPVLPVPAPPTGTPAVQARDAEDLLCMTVTRFAADGSDCVLPPAKVTAPVLQVQRRGKAAVLSGIVAAEVASAEVTLDDGNSITVPATDGAPYSGRYAARVRFLAAALPAGRKAVRTVLRSAAGATLATIRGPEVAPIVGPVAALRSPGAPTLFATVVREGSGCVRLGEPTAADPALCQVPAGTIGVLARCSPRQIVLFGRLDASVTSVKVLLRGKRHVRITTVALPARLDGGRALLLAIPEDASPVSMELMRGGKKVKVPLALPAATQQCGYASFPALDAAST